MFKTIISFIKKYFPYGTNRGLYVELVYSWLMGGYRIKDRLNIENFINYSLYSKKEMICNVCGKKSFPLYDFPNLKLRNEHRIEILRETLQCRVCLSTMRHRSLVEKFLNHVGIANARDLISVNEISKNDLSKISILDTDAFSPMSKILRGHPNYFVSSFSSDKPLNTLLGENHYNINLECIGFPDNFFDLILTSDVMEHVRDIDTAHFEIARILKPGGKYIFTVPYDSNCDDEHLLIEVNEGGDKYLVPPQYHGDPVNGGIVAYRVFGQRIFKDLQNIGFEVKLEYIEDEKKMIVNGDVFVATKISSI